MCPRLADNFIIDRYQTSAALSISKESASPVDAVFTLRVATIDVAVVKELQVLLATLLVPWH